MQVPSFDSKVAMKMIEQELGRPWQQVYSQLTPRPIAAASLGQVCLPTCHHTGGPCMHLYGKHKQHKSFQFMFWAQCRSLQLTMSILTRNCEYLWHAILRCCCLGLKGLSQSMTLVPDGWSYTKHDAGCMT